ncbi:unnamed protein product [Didymodactylos carnosus]|uniref:RAP domain-containing protein n=1 Tax=Didymodactylos carnosus TaxID=1234261 RepID=A0A813TXE1_9BILA|nr:unnamed protein product [Didymodactylos carnosus]CAF0929881.1 unnamed protein product [Didymodactylos carnosus]CAF3606227.1 unnamed protein product [Didymodactylos carnosus]CAF3706616.1 unnamed protein product [Didymodactylos carnosus]
MRSCIHQISKSLLSSSLQNNNSFRSSILKSFHKLSCTHLIYSHEPKLILSIPSKSLKHCVRFHTHRFQSQLSVDDETSTFETVEEEDVTVIDPTSDLVQTSTTNVLVSPKLDVLQEENENIIDDPLLSLINKCSSLHFLFPLISINIPNLKHHHIATCILQSCVIIRAFTLFYPEREHEYQQQLLTHPIFQSLCLLCENHLYQLNYTEMVNILFAFTLLDIRMQQSDFLKRLFTQCSLKSNIKQFDLELLNRFTISLIKKSNRSLAIPLFSTLCERLYELLDTISEPDGLKQALSTAALLGGGIPTNSVNDDESEQFSSSRIIERLAEIIDKHIEEYSSTSQTFLRLPNMGFFFRHHISRWLPLLLNSWSENINDYNWFEIHQLLGNIKRNLHFIPKLFDLAVARCEYELNYHTMTSRDLLYMCYSLYKSAPYKLKQQLDNALQIHLNKYSSHEICILYSHVNPDTCNQHDILVQIHQILKMFSLSYNQQDEDFWHVLGTLTNDIKLNIQYYNTNDHGIDFIRYIRTEIDYLKKRSDLCLLRNQFLTLLGFYMKYSINNSIIPDTIMKHVETMISQSTLKDTASLLSAHHLVSSSNVNSNPLFYRQINFIHKAIIRHKVNQANESLYSLGRLSSFLNQIIYRSRYIDSSLEPFFLRLQTFEIIQLKDIRQLCQLFMSSVRLYPNILDRICSTLINSTSEIPLSLLAVYYRTLMKLNYIPIQCERLFSYSVELYMAYQDSQSTMRTSSFIRPFDSLHLAIAQAGLLHKIDHRLIEDVFSLAFLGNLDQISINESENDFKLRQPLFRLNQILSIDHPALEIPWFNDRFGLDVIVPEARRRNVRYPMYEQVEAILTTILGSKDHFLTRSFSPYFHEIDFECMMRTSDGQPVPMEPLDVSSLTDKTLKTPPGLQRIAVQLTTPGNYCINTRHLLGTSTVNFRHLRTLGYKLVVIPYYQWYTMDTVTAKVQYLRNKLLVGDVDPNEM